MLPAVLPAGTAMLCVKVLSALAQDYFKPKDEVFSRLMPYGAVASELDSEQGNVQSACMTTELPMYVANEIFTDL